MSKPVRKAIFPVAGLGTRLLPATKTMPKEMLTDRRPAADPICGRRGARGGDRADDLRHRPRQSRAWSIISTWASSWRRRWSRRGKSLDPLDAVAHRLRRDRLGPPAAAARAWPCGLVRAPYRRRRAVRGAAARRSDGRQARRAQADGRRLCRTWRQYRLRRRKCRPTRPAATASSRRARPRARRPKSWAWSKSRKPEDAPSRLGVIGRYILQPEVMDVLERGRARRRRRNPADRRAWPS